MTQPVIGPDLEAPLDMEPGMLGLHFETKKVTIIPHNGAGFSLTGIYDAVRLPTEDLQIALTFSYNLSFEKF